MVEMTPPLTSKAKYRQGIELFVASFVGLYFEMMMVRWLAAEVRLFSYFKNVTMMAAFMGLGIGFALASRKRAIGSGLSPSCCYTCPSFWSWAA